MQTEIEKNSRYIGDAVYVSNDGFQVWLHLNTHDSEPLVALDPSVLSALVQYAKDKGLYE